MKLSHDAKHSRNKIFDKPWLIREIQDLKYKAYTGVGSRSTPDDIKEDMKEIAVAMSKNSWVVRTGDAEGADRAFRFGSNIAGGPKEVYTPKKSHKLAHHRPGSSKAREIAKEVWSNYMDRLDSYPAWDEMNPYTRSIMSRNTCQVLGYKCRKPSQCLICWTPDGAESGEDTNRSTGGTGQAIRVAEKFDVPVYNLANSDSYDRIVGWASS
jgi:hypothetical protein